METEILSPEDVDPASLEAYKHVLWSMKSNGKSPMEVQAFARSFGLDVPLNTLISWMNIYTERRLILSSPQVAPIHHKLKPEIGRHIIGLGIHLALYKNAFTFSMIKQYLEEEFSLSLSTPIVLDFIRGAGFSYSRSLKGYTLDQFRMVLIAMDHLFTISTPIPYRMVCCVDVTFNSGEIAIPASFKNLTNPLMKDRWTSPYTDCIVTCIWADGVNRTPSLLFTYNPEAKEWKGEAGVFALSEARRLHVAKNRIIYLGKKGKPGYCVPECSQILNLFFSFYAIPKGVTVFSPKRKAFHILGCNDNRTFSFHRHYMFPREVVSFLSPNEKRLHRQAKQTWRRLGRADDSDLISMIKLLYALDKSTYQSHNFIISSLQLDVDLPSAERVSRLIKIDPGNMNEFHDRCLEEYRSSVGIDNNGAIITIN